MTPTRSSIAAVGALTLVGLAGCAQLSEKRLEYTRTETARIDQVTVEPGAGDVVVRTGALHHPNGAVGYRVEFAGRSLCFVTDTEHTVGTRDPAVLDLVRGADVMIYDSTYTDAEYPAHVGWGHSTWEECVRVAEAAGVGQAVIFHHDPARTDDELDAIAAAAAHLRPGTLVAREGAELVLAP